MAHPGCDRLLLSPGHRPRREGLLGRWGCGGSLKHRLRTKLLLQHRSEPHRARDFEAVLRALRRLETARVSGYENSARAQTANWTYLSLNPALCSRLDPVLTAEYRGQSFVSWSSPWQRRGHAETWRFFPACQ